MGDGSPRDAPSGRSETGESEQRADGRDWQDPAVSERVINAGTHSGRVGVSPIPMRPSPWRGRVPEPQRGLARVPGQPGDNELFGRLTDYPRWPTYRKRVDIVGVFSRPEYGPRSPSKQSPGSGREWLNGCDHTEAAEIAEAGGLRRGEGQVPAGEQARLVGREKRRRCAAAGIRFATPVRGDQALPLMGPAKLITKPTSPAACRPQVALCPMAHSQVRSQF